MEIEQPPLYGYRKIAADLAESTRQKAESEQARWLAEMSLPPISAGGPRSGEMPRSGTEGQRSEWRQYSYDRPGSDQPAETREPLDS